jgi:carbamate kinase
LHRDPKEILELSTIRLLLDAGVLVICAGGGRHPRRARSRRRDAGSRGVIDEDLTAALLARRLGADVLLMLTDVPAVEAGWGTPGARRSVAFRRATCVSSRSRTGSMGPKIEAACRFVEATGGTAAIGA